MVRRSTAQQAAQFRELPFAALRAPLLRFPETETFIYHRKY